MIKEIIILAFLLVCCMCLPTVPLQKVVAVVVQPEGVKVPASVAENHEIFATAESGWRNRGYGGGYGHGGGGYEYGGGWKRGGGYRGGNYGGGWKNRG